MITRVWEGKTSIKHSDTYTNLIQERDIPGYRETEGFVKLTFLKRSDTVFTYFKLLTFWEDIEAVKNFTGPIFEHAVAYEEDEPYLVDYPGQVMHYEVFAG